MRAAVLVLLALPVVASPEEEVRIRKLFDALTYAAKNGGGPALVQHFDLREIKAAFQEGGMQGPVLEGALAAFRGNLGETLAGVGFERTRVRKVTVAANGKAATAVVDHLQDDVWARLRWSLVERAAGWALTDFQNLETGLRYAATISASTAAILGGGESAFDRFQQAESLLEQERYPEAIAAYRALQSSKLPKALKATCLLEVANACYALEKYEDVLAACDEAARLDDMPALHYLRSIAHNALGQHDPAIASARRYIETVGPDADAYAEIGDAYRRLGKPQESAAAYRAGLEERPDAGMLVASLAIVLPYDRKAEAVARFRALPAAREWMETIGETCIDHDDWIALAAFAPAFAELAPGSTDAIYYDARLRAHDGAHEEAAKRLLAALPTVADPDERQAFVHWYVDSMTEAGKPLDAYKALPVGDRPQAFYALADGFSDGKQPDELDALIKLRARDPGAQELLLVWQAELLWLRARYADVARFVQDKRAAILLADEDRAWMAEDRWVRSLHRLKRHDECHRAAAECSDPDLSLLAHAANGDLDAATAAFERCLEQGWEPGQLYEDEDIGPLLQTEKLAPLRAKYPAGK